MAEVNGDSAPPQTIGASPQPAAPSGPTATPQVPLTSLHDNGTSKRPRDSRLIHMLLTSLGVTAYQERVPLQVLDFAYRHSSSILSDALHLSADAYQSQTSRAKDAPASGVGAADGQVTVPAVHIAIQSRLQYQFSGGNGLSKEFLLETAYGREGRNKVALPRVLQNEWGVRLPSERFVLTGVPWGLQSEMETVDENEVHDGMEGVESAPIDTDIGEEGEEGGTMEDLFGVGASEGQDDMEGIE